MTSIAEYNKRLTPKQRSENSRKPAMARISKEKNETRKSTPLHELASLLGKAKIIKGVPLAEKMRSGLQSIYIPFFDKFAVGDCVYFDDIKNANKIYAATKIYGQKSGKIFAIRSKIKEDGIKVCGLWRIK